MDYQLGLYEKALPSHLTLHEKLVNTKIAGFDYLEISIDESEEKQARLYWSDKQISALKAAIDDTGVPILSMCLSGHRKYPLGSHDAHVRHKGMEIMDRALELAVRLGIRIIQLAGYDVYYEESNDETAAYFLQNLERAVRLAASRGVVLGFETMETSFLDTVAKGMKFVRKINSPYLGMYPDIGNLKNASCIYHTNIVDDLQEGTGKIFAAHLKETKPGIYRNMQFGTGHTEYSPCISELISQGVRLFTGEFWHQGEENWLEITKESGVFLRNRIEEAV